MRNRGWSAFLCLGILVLTVSGGWGQEAWTSLFDGKTMNGWRRMAVHGGNGGIWTVEKGALVADQEPDHKGGLLGTEATYGDFEIELEFKADDPADTGLFLRTQPDGMGYQVTIDYHAKGMIGSLYAPGQGGFLQQNREWRRAFRVGEWNRLRARITGQPAHVEAWLNGAKMTDFQDHRERFPREGVIGLQVHGGAGSWGEASRARYRNIRLRRL
jgi:hypothetical protein